jgi:hypothetical protein
MEPKDSLLYSQESAGLITPFRNRMMQPRGKYSSFIWLTAKLLLALTSNQHEI